MSSVEDRVVGMKFDNKQFESGAAQSIGTFKKLKDASNMKGASAGVDGLQQSVSRFSLQGMLQGIQNVSQKFGAMSVVGVTALATLTSKAVNFGLNMAKAMTFKPMMDGFAEYETKIGSIQTILANTQRYGTKLSTVNKSLSDLNAYADKTIYSFGDMTKNIGLFTNAGIKVEDATSMIKGFSNAAAASGTSSQGASGAAYQLSQALSTGTVRLMDWRSLTNVGMGNKNMQLGIIDIANAMGTFTKHGTTANAAQKDFNGSLEKGWLTADVMSTYLKIMAGDMTVAQMKAMGLNATQIKTFQLQAKTAQDAATKVRTFTQLVGTIQEALGSSWGATAEILIGDFDKASQLWTSINNVVSPMIDRMGDQRNKLLSAWAKMGGRDSLIQALSNAFTALLSVMKPIGQAFREVFPPTTAATLLKMTQAFQNFTLKLILGAKTANDLKRTFAGLFAAVHIVWTVLKAVGQVIVGVISSFSGAGGSILSFTAGIGDAIVKFDKFINSGNGLHNVIKAIVTGLTTVIGVAKAFGGAIKDAFAGIFSGAGAKDALNTFSTSFGSRLLSLTTLAKAAGKVISWITEKMKTVAPYFESFGRMIGNFGKGVADALSVAFATGNFSGLTSLINTGLLATITVGFRKFVKVLGELKEKTGGNSLTKIVDGLTGSLGAMQSKLKAETLGKIAAAIAVLTVSVVALSLVNPSRLTSSLTAITVMFTQLMGALAAMDAITKGINLKGTGTAIAAMLGLAIAIDILSIAVVKLAGISWGGLAKGLTAVTILLAELIATSALMGNNSKGMIRSAAGLILFAVAINILATAVAKLGELDLATMAKGLASVMALMAMIVAFNATNDVGGTSIRNSTGILILAVAMNVLASAVGKFGSMDLGTLAKGIATMGVLLAFIDIFSNTVGGPQVLAAGAAMLIISASMLVFGAALSSIASLSWGELAVGMTGIAGGLLMMALAANSMTAALPGAAAILVISVALSLLIPQIIALSGLSWGDLAVGMVGLAAVFAIFGVAGMLLAPLIPVLLALGAAMLLVGVGVLAFGVGLALAATGLAGLAVAITAFSTAFAAAVLVVFGVMPQMVSAIVNGIRAVLIAIIANSTLITAAMVVFLMGIIRAVNQVLPAIVSTLVRMVVLMVSTITRMIPYLVNAGGNMIVGILNGVARNIGRIVRAGTNVIVAFLNGVSANIGRVATAGVHLVVSFVNGVAGAIRSQSGALRSAGVNLAMAIVDGMTGGLASGVQRVASQAASMAKRALGAAKSALGIKSPSKEFKAVGAFAAIGMALGISSHAGAVNTASKSMAMGSLSAVKAALSSASDLMVDTDIQPVITPVVDMSNVENAAGGLKNRWGSYSVGLSRGNTLANGIQWSDTGSNVSVAPATGASVSLVQNNYSPKALSRIDIYRDTKMQLSNLKRSL